MNKMSLRQKLLTIGVTLTIVPMIIASVLVYIGFSEVTLLAGNEAETLVGSDLNHVVKNVYDLCDTQHQLLVKQMDSNIKLSYNHIEDQGGFRVDESKKQMWDVKDKSGSYSVELPQLTVGETMISPDMIGQDVIPLVDEMKKICSATTTIFQKMNMSGDMLRVATTVRNEDGSRAIGTVMSADSEIVRTVLNGQSYEGRSKVLNKWYITKYVPVQDHNNGQLIGMYCLAVPLDEYTFAREAILRTKIGDSGYIFVLGTKGDEKGTYYISQRGERDGENILKAQDTKGKYFIQEMIEQVAMADPGEITHFEYEFGELNGEPRYKTSQLVYFEQWDWLIGSSAYLDELYEARNNIQMVGARNQRQIWIGALFITLIASAIWFFMSGNITNRIKAIMLGLTESVSTLSVSSKEMSQLSSDVAAGASDQAASLEETSASLEELNSIVHENADHTVDADQRVQDTMDIANHCLDSMYQMEEVMNKINKSADEQASIIKTIDDIAFQTNLLSLNAAVEAARAGEAGAGFAVVAEEVRNLAMRSAEAAKSTNALIQDALLNANDGVKKSEQVAAALEQMKKNIDLTGDVVKNVTIGSKEQAKGIELINTAISRMEAVTIQNAASSEESANSSNEVHTQADKIDEMMHQLESLLEGH